MADFVAGKQCGWLLHRYKLVDLARGTHKQCKLLRLKDWRDYHVAMIDYEVTNCGGDVHYIATKPEFQRLGIANHFLDMAELEMCKGRARLYIHCSMRMQDFYKKRGYRLTNNRERTPYYREMIKMLDRQ